MFKDDVQTPRKASAPGPLAYTDTSNETQLRLLIVQESKTHLVKSERLGSGQQEGYQLTTNISIL